MTITEKTARALQNIVSLGTDGVDQIRREYAKVTKTLADFSQELILWVVPFALTAVVLGVLSPVPPIGTAVVYALITLLAFVYVTYRRIRPILNLGIGDWTARRLLKALKKGETENWADEAKDAVVGLRRGVRNVVAIGLLPVLAATWALGADPYHQWLALFGFLSACLLWIVGFVSPPEDATRGRLITLALLLIAGSAAWSAWVNPNSWFNQIQEKQEAQALAEEEANRLPPCARNPEMVVVEDDDPGITEYLVGRIDAGCVTGIISPPPGEWEDWGISPRDRGSKFSISFEGMPTQFMSCGGGDEFFFPDTWPTFRLEGGSGYMTLWVWDENHPGPPGDHICF